MNIIQVESQVKYNVKEQITLIHYKKGDLKMTFDYDILRIIRQQENGYTLF